MEKLQFEHNQIISLIKAIKIQSITFNSSIYKAEKAALQDKWNRNNYCKDFYNNLYFQPFNTYFTMSFSKFYGAIITITSSTDSSYEAPDKALPK